MHSGEAYGAQAVLSAAHQKATGTAVTAYDWSSKDQAARILRELGFRVLAGDDPEAVVPVTGEWRETSEVGPDVTRDAWATAARERLLEAARRYRATVPPQELAIEVQRRSGIRTRQLWHHWIDEVIGRVALESARLDEPLIVSLCADDAGRVTEGYPVAVRAVIATDPQASSGAAWKAGYTLRVCALSQHTPLLPLVPFPAGGISETRVDIPIEQASSAGAGTRTGYPGDPLPSGANWSWCP